MSESPAPFMSLGNHLKYVREQARQSLAEVSGAVEIDEAYLQRIEAGVERPAEDILLLLISHFGVKDREANRHNHKHYPGGRGQSIGPCEEPGVHEIGCDLFIWNKVGEENE